MGRFRRQLLQRLPVSRLSWPSKQSLGDWECQTALHNLLNSEIVPHSNLPPGKSSLWLRTLCARLGEKVQAAAHVSEEGDVYDPLLELCARMQTFPTLTDVEDSETGVCVVYEGDGQPPWQICLLEKPRLITCTGFTGFRTWEAALALAHTIHDDWLPQGKLTGKKVLELGAGTGLLSLVCASGPNRAACVVATDGDEAAMHRLNESFNCRSDNIVDLANDFNTGVYWWGNQFKGTVIGEELQKDAFDVVIGADIIYDPFVISDLVQTLLLLFKANSQMRVILSLTVRRGNTLDEFVQSLDMTDCVTIVTEAPVKPMDEQTCFFYDSTQDIRFIEILANKDAQTFWLA